MHSTKRTLIALAALLAAVCATTTAALAGPSLAGTSNAGTSHRAAPLDHQLNGTWSTTVQLSDAPPGAPTSFMALDTFLSGGGLLVSSSAAMPATRGLAHGVWTHTGHRTFTSTFVWFRFDPAGQPVGTQRVHRTMVLAKGRGAFHATDVIEVIAPNGAVVATIHGTEDGVLLEDS